MDATVFDFLSPDAVRNLFRLCSERPLAKDWQSYVPLEDVWRLYIGIAFFSRRAVELSP